MRGQRDRCRCVRAGKSHPLGCKRIHRRRPRRGVAIGANPSRAQRVDRDDDEVPRRGRNRYGRLRGLRATRQDRDTRYRHNERTHLFSILTRAPYAFCLVIYHCSRGPTPARARSGPPLRGAARQPSLAARAFPFPILMSHLHVLNGDSTPTGLERSGVPGQFVSWADVLYEGPTPAGVTPDEWRRVRVQYLAGRGYGNETDIARRGAEDDARMESWRNHEEVVFW